MPDRLILQHHALNHRPRQQPTCSGTMPGYQDAVGVWTIGYGTTATTGVGIIPKAGMAITETQASAYLVKAVEKFAARITAGITVPVDESQFGAMVSLAYNIGPGTFLGSTLLCKLNAGHAPGATDQSAA